MARDRPASDEARDTLLRKVERIRPVLEEAGDRAEAERRLPDAAYDAMLDAGLFRMLVPAALGGLELHPATQYAVVEAVARIDAAAAWNLNQSCSMGGFASWLSKEGGEEVFARGPDTILAGGLFPPGPSVRVAGGWRVTARTAFASGANRAQWFGVPILEVAEDASRFDPDREDPPPLVAFVPRDEVDIVDTWNTVGMRGTFSADVLVDDVFVPDHRVALVERGRERGPAFSGPVYRTVPWPGIQGETVVSLGVARAAIDELVDLAARKTPSYGRTELRDRERAQHHAARATALVDASRVFLADSIAQALEEAERLGDVGEAAKRRCQLAACFGAEACGEAVDLVCEVAGTTAIRIGQKLERHRRDVHVLTQHVDKTYARYEDVGKMLFGLPPSFFILEL